jgi:phytanoyl-CoA dioxygenase PhyH
MLTSVHIVGSAVRTPDHDSALARITAAVERHGLAEHVAELDAYGCTVVPPAKVAATDVDAILDRVLDLMEQRNGARPDLESGATHVNVSFPTLYYFLFEDPLFQEWLLNPTMLALVEYLVGERSILHATTVFMKGPSDPPEHGLQLALHTDQQSVPEPFPPYAFIVGATLLLTDYTREDGAFAYVPGSHRLGRHPVGQEGADRAVAVEAPKGSLLVHHGALWHGSFGRTKPGLRVGMAYAFSRLFMAPLEAYRENVTKDMLDRHPPRFATLLGQDVATGTMEVGPDLHKVAKSVVRSPWE